MLRKSVFVAALALLPALALSQPRQGDWELTLAGSGSADRDIKSGVFGAYASVGTYVTDQVSVSVRNNLDYANPPGGGTSWNNHLRLAGDFHFDLDVWQPFVGVHFGYQSGPAKRDGFTAGPQGGVKYYVNNRTFVFGLAEYTFGLRGGGARARGWNFATGLGFNW